MSNGEFRRCFRERTPALTQRIDELVGLWLAPLRERLATGLNSDEYRPKQVNDPIWGTIELRPWEVALLDTPLLQRMRGVKQLGLASLVFPGASHDRLEHIVGVVGATDKVIYALSQQIERWSRDNPTKPLPNITTDERYALRLAALLHDIGHGPFSHALEPVLDLRSVLLPESADADGADWRSDLEVAKGELLKVFSLNKPPALGELISVAMILSQPMAEVLADSRLLQLGPADDLLEFLVSCIIGAVDGPGACYLTSIISSDIDADKLDYYARDAHHSGLEIGFDTDRLLSKLEVLRVTPDNIDAAARELRDRALSAQDQTFLQIGIAAAGFGSFEQMLIGRTFLYDRLYHHHKVRAAEAMAQRLMLVAERDRKKRFDLKEIFMRVGDETMLRLLAGELTHSGFEVSSPAAASLARGILDRDLLHRAFAFRGRFISCPPGLSAERKDSHRQALWRQIVKELEKPEARFALGVEIHETAVECAKLLADAGVDASAMDAYHQALTHVGPEQIIVDLPASKAGAIRLLARYPNGALKVPEFSFNPIKWTDAYELQKRTGYVFCPRAVLPIIALAARIVFLGRFGVALTDEADGYIKASRSIKPSWIPSLRDQGMIDAAVADLLTSKRFSLVKLRADDLNVPEAWIGIDPDLPVSLAVELNRHLGSGLPAEDVGSLGKVLSATFAIIDTWFDSERVTRDLADERELQRFLRDAYRLRSLKVSEGLEVGGGELDLYVENSILIENKFARVVATPETAAPAAGMQGRRYAVSLSSQVVIVFVGYKPKPGEFPDKVKCVSVHSISSGDRSRVEIRVSLPYNAVKPSSEAADPTRT